MTEEDEEFQRLEREVKLRRRAEEDDDIQDYKKPWVGLTDEEMLSIEEATTCTKDESWLRNVTRAIEQRLKEKNA